MNKQVIYNQDEFDFPLVDLVGEKGLEKTASYKEAGYSEDIVDFLSSMQPEDNKIYALVNAMTAGEYYGPNKNADWFGEDVLKKHHQTFVNDGHVYTHHQNKDPKKSLGDILFSSFNDKMKRVELVISLDIKKDKTQEIIESLRNGEVIATSMGCFKGDAPVTLPDGTSKYIADIKEGEYILTHKGNKKKVTKLEPRFYKGFMYKFKISGKYTDNIECTEEHPILVFSEEQVWKEKGCRKSKLSLEKAKWKKAKDVLPTDLVVRPKISLRDIPSEVNKDEARLLGYYLAEGYCKKSDYGVNFSVNKNDESLIEIPKLADKLGYKLNINPNSTSDKALELTIYDKYLQDLCLKYCGTGAHDKKLHEDIFHWPKEYKKQFLGAHISGDGFFFKNSPYVSSCNKELQIQLQYLCSQLGINTGLYRNIHKAGKGFSTEETIEWVLRLSTYSNSVLYKYSSKIENNSSIKSSGNGGPYDYKNFSLYKIEDIYQNFYEGPVFNFEVQDDHSYCVGGYAVHNCRVPYDRCAVCGNKAKTRLNYCDHLKHNPNKILPDGRRVYAINIRPKFFDLSIVTIPADPTSGFMSTFGLDRIKTAEHKETKAEINKKIDGEITHLEEDPKRLILNSQKELTDEQIEKLSEYPLNEVLSTFLGMRIMPKRAEFQKLALYSLGQKDMADNLEKKGTVFEANPEDYVIPDDISLANYNDEVENVIGDDIYKMALLKPLVISRTLDKYGQQVESNDPGMPNVNVFNTDKPDPRSFIKRIFFDQPSEAEQKVERSPVKNPIAPMVTLGTLYSGYAQIFGKTDPSKFIQFIRNKPWLAPLLAGGVAVGSAQLQHNQLQKTAGTVKRFLTNSLIATPVSYYSSAVAEGKAQQGVPISNTEDFVRKHPLLTSFLGSVGATTLQGSILKRWDKSKGLMKNLFSKTAEFTCRLDIEQMNTIYNDLFKKYKENTWH